MGTRGTVPPKWWKICRDVAGEQAAAVVALIQKQADGAAFVETHFVAKAVLQNRQIVPARPRQGGAGARLRWWWNGGSGGKEFYDTRRARKKSRRAATILHFVRRSTVIPIARAKSRRAFPRTSPASRRSHRGSRGRRSSPSGSMMAVRKAGCEVRHRNRQARKRSPAYRVAGCVKEISAACRNTRVAGVPP